MLFIIISDQYIYYKLENDRLLKIRMQINETNQKFDTGIQYLLNKLHKK
jgi:hypothetical protein